MNNQHKVGDQHKSDSDLSSLLLPDQNIASKIDPEGKSVLVNQTNIKQEKKHIQYTKFDAQPDPKKQIFINLHHTQ